MLTRHQRRQIAADALGVTLDRQTWDEPLDALLQDAVAAKAYRDAIVALRREEEAK